MSRFQVDGEIVFAQPPALPHGAKAYVSLHNTSLADAASKVVAEKVLADIADKANRGKPIPFSLEGTLRDARDEYTIRVLVDLDGDGKISLGDFINMQSYPVITYGNPSRVAVEVKKIE